MPVVQSILVLLGLQPPLGFVSCPHIICLHIKIIDFSKLLCNHSANCVLMESRMAVRVCALVILLFGCFERMSAAMNVSCVSDTCSVNGTQFCEVCNISTKVGNSLRMVCDVSRASVSCSEPVQRVSVGSIFVNIGGIFSWLCLGGRAVYKLFHTSPREDYMRGKLQSALSSELVGFAITIPSIASIVFEFVDVSWGDHLVNIGPLAVGLVQIFYDAYKGIRSRQHGHREELFKKFITKLDEDLRSGDDARCCLLTSELFEWARVESETLGIWDNVNDDEYTLGARRVLVAFHTLLVMNCRNAEDELNGKRFKIRSVQYDTESVGL